jgi:hypothetical protein
MDGSQIETGCAEQAELGKLKPIKTGRPDRAEPAGLGRGKLRCFAATTGPTAGPDRQPVAGPSLVSTALGQPCLL